MPPSKNQVKKIVILDGKYYQDGQLCGDVISEENGSFKVKWNNGSLIDGTIFTVNLI